MTSSRLPLPRCSPLARWHLTGALPDLHRSSAPVAVTSQPRTECSVQQPLTVAHDSRSSCSALGAAWLPLADPSRASATGRQVSQGLAVVWGRGSSRAVWFPSSRGLARPEWPRQGSKRVEFQGLLR